MFKKSLEYFDPQEPTYQYLRTDQQENSYSKKFNNERDLKKTKSGFLNKLLLAFLSLFFLYFLMHSFQKKPSSLKNAISDFTIPSITFTALYFPATHIVHLTVNFSLKSDPASQKTSLPIIAYYIKSENKVLLGSTIESQSIKLIHSKTNTLNVEIKLSASQKKILERQKNLEMELLFIEQGSAQKIQEPIIIM